jgi:hypothetical protein
MLATADPAPRHSRALATTGLGLLLLLALFYLFGAVPIWPPSPATTSRPITAAPSPS